MKSCPRCNVSLAATQVGNVTVDGCHRCGGVWFDPNEINAIASMTEPHLLRLEQRFNAQTGIGQPPVGACPVCGVPLFEFAFPHSPHIRLDGCPQCRGIWVDDGELQAIYNRLQSAAAVSEATSAQASRQQAHQVVGFLSQVACPQCGKPNPKTNRVCWDCDTPLGHPGGILCPYCDDPLRSVAFLNIALDVCYDCDGVWLDAGDLPTLLHHADAAAREIAQETGHGIGTMDPVLQPDKTLLCPQCILPLRQDRYGGDTNLLVDRCGKCTGVWVSVGELRLIAEKYV